MSPPLPPSKQGTTYSRKPLADISNKLISKSSQSKKSYHPHENTDSDDLSFELGTFQQLKNFPTDLPDTSNDHISYIDELNSLSFSHSEDSLDMLPEKYPAKQMTNTNSRQKVSTLNPTKKTTANTLSSVTFTSNSKPQKPYRDQDSGSSAIADYLLLKARFESLRTKYDMLLSESQEKISTLQAEKLEYEQKVKDHDSILKHKISQQQQEFSRQHKETSDAFEQEKTRLEEKISALQSENSALSLSLEGERQENATLQSHLQQLRSSLAQHEENEVILKSEISRLESIPTWKTPSSSSSRVSDPGSLHAQIRALEDALTAERHLSAAKLSAVRQENEEEHEQIMLFAEEKIRSDMHAQWKRRLSQIKESWSLKKRSLINKVTKAFERRLTELSAEWEREKSLLLARLRTGKPSSATRYHRSFDPSDSIADDDFFSDSFKIDGEEIFEDRDHLLGGFKSTDRDPGFRRETGYQQLFRSPLLRKTPHFMSRSRMPPSTTE